MQRPFSGGLTAAGGVCALVVGLAAIDDRVREQIAHAFSSKGPSEMATAGTWLLDLVLIAVQAVRDQSIEHAPLVIFGLAALVLVLFMLRT